MEVADEPQRGGLHCGLPTDTRITPPAVGISHQQFFDEIIGEALPGDNSGRGGLLTPYLCDW